MWRIRTVPLLSICYLVNSSTVVSQNLDLTYTYFLKGFPAFSRDLYLKFLEKPLECPFTRSSIEKSASTNQ
jgi:hypothetical protein